MKDLSIIIINYNSSKYSIDCIQSILDHEAKYSFSYEIVVVDNNSKLGDYNTLKAQLPNSEKVQLHRSVINTGFGGGNMFGMQFASGRYTLFLNNDTLVNAQTLPTMYSYMETNKKVGVCTAQNFDEHGDFVPSFDHFKGIRKMILGRSFLEKNWAVSHPKRKKQHQEPVTVNFVNGACMFFRTEVFAEIGGFDTNIFLYFEEMDVCYRLEQLGFSSVLLPQATITHYQGVSTGSSFAVDCEGIISHLYVIKKNYPYFKYFFIKNYLLVQAMIKPKRMKFFKLLFKGAAPQYSLKTKQKITML